MGYRIIKRLFDIFIGSIAIFVLIIPWIIITIIIKIQSPGPALFKAKRVGMNGKVFTLYKFRTMETNNGIIHPTTLRGDPRVFPFGSFLRISKLDETPQLINVIKGDMSIIGPRPEDILYADKLFVGKFKRILSIKPGLSSPASLYDYTHGEDKYSCEDDYIHYFYPKKMKMELYYVDHQSLKYDFKIIIRTIITIVLVLSGKNDFDEPKELQK